MYIQVHTLFYVQYNVSLLHNINVHIAEIFPAPLHLTTFNKILQFYYRGLIVNKILVPLIINNFPYLKGTKLTC